MQIILDTTHPENMKLYDSLISHIKAIHGVYETNIPGTVELGPKREIELDITFTTPGHPQKPSNTDTVTLLVFPIKSQLHKPYNS